MRAESLADNAAVIDNEIAWLREIPQNPAPDPIAGLSHVR
jgi:hypothetical protein